MEKTDVKLLINSFLQGVNIEELKKLAEILAAISDWQKLVEMWEDTLIDSRQGVFIEDRITEFLSSISDWQELKQIWGDAPSRLKPEVLVAERMAEVVSMVNPQRPQQWFLDLVTNPRSIPRSGVLMAVIKKAREIAAHE